MQINKLVGAVSGKVIHIKGHSAITYNGGIDNPTNIKFAFDSLQTWIGEYDNGKVTIHAIGYTLPERYEVQS